MVLNRRWILAHKIVYPFNDICVHGGVEDPGMRETHLCRGGTPFPRVTEAGADVFGFLEMGWENFTPTRSCMVSGSRFGVEAYRRRQWERVVGIEVTIQGWESEERRLGMCLQHDERPRLPRSCLGPKQEVWWEKWEVGCVWAVSTCFFFN